MDDLTNPVAIAGPWPGRGWSTVSRGLHHATDRHVDELSGLHAWQLIAGEDGAFTHFTAARVRDWWTPPVPEGSPVWMTNVAPHLSRRPGLKVIRGRSAPTVRSVAGLRLTSAAETICHVASDVGVLDVIVVADAALHAGDVTLAELDAVAGQRRKGVRILRQALPFLDAKAESPWESVLRVFHTFCDAPVESQAEIRDERGFIARADLLLRGTKVAHEYDGAVHRDAQMHRSDLRRDRRLLNAGYARRGYTSDDLLHRPTSILADIDLALDRPHRPSRLSAWFEIVNASLYTASGRAHFHQRIQRYKKLAG